jgi:cytochrome c biogenesis protein CcmG, thiol:disulfide interchange protein DsbE
MPNRRRAFIPILLITLTLISVSGANPKIAVGGGASVGSKAPGFTLKDLDGNDVSLSEYRGNVILLNFWATYCGPCRSEMSSLEALKGEMEDYGFVILAVSIDPYKAEKVKEFVENRGYTFRVLLSPKKEVMKLYYFTGIPTTYIIDREGIIVEKAIGSEDWDSAERIDQLKALSIKKEPGGDETGK